MAEVAPAGNGGGVNRTFLLIIGGLAGLLILGLVAAGVLLFLPSLLGGGKTPVAATSLTPTKVALQPATAPKPSQTPLATATLVVVAAAASPTSPTFITATPVKSGGITSPGGAGSAVTPATGGETSKGGVASGGELPSSGLGENLLLLAVGLALVAVMFIARRVRGTG